jgi:hypothetical protein
MAKQRTPFLNPHFGAAVREFGLSLKKTSSIKHKGNRGGARERALRAFFEERLPSRYSVTEGEVVDLYGNTSPQLDLLFFDGSVNFQLNGDSTSILPAEALLASVEVKTKLTVQEIHKSCIAARKLRELRPYDKELGGVNIAASTDAGARYYHCIFAYETSIGSANWLAKESKRLKVACGGAHLIDAVYVLNRGLINLGHQIAQEEDADGAAITSFYFSILNFLQREGGRREPTPYSQYVTHGPKWKRI